ncbi:MAG: hypothetical protein AVO35_13090 [Candidatus Aegiribacteria sp. MLS_C]|nr:MAG: hypothetical protein AVO35_13090 [Candidatus Aegiribacteria sp. MLS_C]
MRKASVITAFMIVLFCMACGEEAVRPEDTQPMGPIDPYGDPPDYSGEDPFANFPDVTGVSIPSGEVETVEDEQEEILAGTHFTIQISAATSEEAALSLAESVQGETTHPVFIDQEGIYWKVRVGAFPARQDALDYAQTIVEMGFTDAWVTTRQP